MGDVVNFNNLIEISPAIDKLVDNLELAGVYFGIVEKSNGHIIVFEFNTPNVPDTAMNAMRELSSIFKSNDKIADDMIMYCVNVGGYFRDS